MEARARRQNENRNQAEQYYSDVLRQVLPLQRLYLPSLSQASKLSCFIDLMDPDRETQRAEWEHAATELPMCLSEWMSKQKERHIGLLPCQSAQAKSMEVTLLSSPSIDRWRHGEMLKSAGQLDLATSVFRYPGTDMVLIGRDACHAWKGEGQLQYSARGAEAVQALLRTLQLNPASATISTLDQLDKQFICGGCADDTRHTWRYCVCYHLSPCVVSHWERCIGGALY